MADHEVPDGTYPATVATRTERLVALISPPCDPVVLIAPEDTFPRTEITAGDSMTITISDGRVTDCEDDIK